MGFWKKLFGLEAEAAPAIAGMTARALDIAQEGVAEVRAEVTDLAKTVHAKYRLDAIKRTIEQDINGVLTSAHMAEFKAEIRDCVHILVKAGVITDAQAAAIIQDGKGATL